MKIICGIEEAGRGPVIGPMVMAGVSIEDKEEDKLREMGVKDSKLLTPSQREGLFDRIKKIAKNIDIVILPAKEIDDTLMHPTMNLNWLEAATSTMIINKLKPDTAILDCPSPNLKAYSDYVRKDLKDKSIKIISEHKADVNYPVVSAASIIAKVTRDREIQKIKERIKINFGSGYPADPRTVKFLKENYDKFDKEGIFRKTWASYKRVAEKKNQKGLLDF